MLGDAFRTILANVTLLDKVITSFTCVKNKIWHKITKTSIKQIKLLAEGSFISPYHALKNVICKLTSLLNKSWRIPLFNQFQSFIEYQALKLWGITSHASLR